MRSGPENSWQKRYETAAARDRERSDAFAQHRFGGGVGRTLRRESPWASGMGPFGYLLLGWEWVACHP